MTRTTIYPLAAFLLIAVLLFVVSTTEDTLLERVHKDGKLRIATRVGPLTYQPRALGVSGLDYDLAARFAEYLGVKPEFHPVYQRDILSLLELGKVDIAAANIAISESRMDRFLFGPQYHSKSGVLVGNRNRKLPHSLNELSGFRILVPAGSRFAEDLGTLRWDYPALNRVVMDKSGVEDLLTLISEDESLLGLVDSNEFDRIRFLYPEVVVAFEMIKPQPVAWAFRKNDDLSLYRKAIEFFQHQKLSGELQSLENHYAVYQSDLDYVDSIRFIERLRQRLPEYRELFLKAAEKTGLDWRLLAAMSYQESHWDKDAKSFTGVRGLMMLTSETASQLNIEDRTDPEQSIMGGAKYLQKLLQELPLRIQTPDRLWLALAAYNIGRGHLEDARIITERQGGDPDRWLEVRSRLKLLSDENWYSQTKHGKARGHEPIRYVHNVRRYYEVLKSLDKIDVELDRVEKLLSRDIITSPVL